MSYNSLFYIGEFTVPIWLASLRSVKGADCKWPPLIGRSEVGGSRHGRGLYPLSPSHLTFLLTIPSCLLTYALSPTSTLWATAHTYSTQSYDNYSLFISLSVFPFSLWFDYSFMWDHNFLEPQQNGSEYIYIYLRSQVMGLSAPDLSSCLNGPAMTPHFVMLRKCKSLLTSLRLTILVLQDTKTWCDWGSNKFPIFLDIPATYGLAYAANNITSK